MPKMSEMFPSNFLSKDDVGERMYKLLIEHVKFEKMPDGEDKPVVYFRNARKGLVLNKTNAETLCALCGSDNSDEWAGASIAIYVADAVFAGKPTKGLRISPQHSLPPPRRVPAAPQSALPTPLPEAAGVGAGPTEEQIPF